MHQHHEQPLLPFPTSTLYALVADVERYPEFLPWCKGARVSEVTTEGFLGELLIAYKHMRESYVSRVTLTPPQAAHGPCAIHVALVRGPFKHLVNHWEFVPEADATRVHFRLEFAFSFPLLERLMGGFFERAAATMVAAFTARATALYGMQRQLS